VIGKGDWTFDYSASGQIRRASRVGRQIDFIYDDDNQRLLKRVDGVPVRAEVAGGILTEGQFIELVVVDGVVAGVLDNNHFTGLLTDPRGTPFAADGTSILATPYGVRNSHPSLAEVIDFARLGRDTDLDLIRMGVRDYDARLGQFLTPDPLYLENLEKCQASPLQCSLYGYAAPNPISFVDRSGLDPLSDLFSPPSSDPRRDGIRPGESNTPDMVRGIRSDMNFFPASVEAAEGAAEVGKIAGGMALDVAPFIGTVRAYDRGDYVGVALGVAGDLAVVGRLASVALKAARIASMARAAKVGETLYVFRELSVEDRAAYDAGRDLVARGKGGTIAEHVAGQPTKYISGGEKASAIAKYSSGNGLAQIDVQAAIDAGAGYVCHENVCASVAREFGRGSLHYENASNALEVLFKNFIPNSAVTIIRD
jgi:RHS repeat-associated protein